MTMQSGTMPRSWPSNVAYLTSPRLSAKLTNEHKKAISCSLGSDQLDKNTIIQKPGPAPCPEVRITPINDAEHPAFGQHGLYAARHLSPGSFILHYIGYVHGPDDVDPHSDYDISLEQDHDIGVDATQCGNEARFINDYRGVTSNGPNAEFRDCWVESKKGVLEKRIGIFVLSAGKSGKRSKGIAKNEEILVSYGKGFWSNRQSSKA